VIAGLRHHYDIGIALLGALVAIALRPVNKSA
jgi:hypothetical protein